MPDPRCWKCNGAEMPPDDCARLGLCAEHLAERVRAIMGEKGKPAA